jgi:hypothetical protein
MEPVEALKVYVSTIYNIDASRLNRDQIEGIYIMGTSVGNMNKSGDRSLQIH